MINTFVEKVTKCFVFLAEEYKFDITFMENSKRGPEVEGLVVFSSKTTRVRVNGENGGVGVGFGRVKDRVDQNLTPQIVYEFNKISEIEKRIVLSHNMTDDKRARDIIWSKKLPSGSRLDDMEQNVIRQLSEQAHWLQLYAEPFLRGDFSNWLEIFEYQVERMRGEYIRSGREEFVRKIGLGEDGKLLMLGKESTFQTSLDYLEQLRIEYGKKV